MENHRFSNEPNGKSPMKELRVLGTFHENNVRQLLMLLVEIFSSITLFL